MFFVVVIVVPSFFSHNIVQENVHSVLHQCVHGLYLYFIGWMLYILFNFFSIISHLRF